MRARLTRAFARTDRPPSVWIGALAGVLASLVFAELHTLVISDIWFNLTPMLIAGAVCGACLAWSYNAAVLAHSTRRWLAYNGLYAALIVALGGASFVVLEPRFTMAEMSGSDDALGQLLPPAVPLMIAAVAAGTVVVWLAFGRRTPAVVPIAVTQALVVLLVGHNLAFLGLVEPTSALLAVVLRFVGVTFILAAVFAAGAMLLSLIPPRSRWIA